MAERDEWRERLAAQLLGAAAPSPRDFSPGAVTALEIAFGHARSEVTYVLEFARAHALPATGSVIGDEVSLTLGRGTVRLRIDRRERCITVTVPGEDLAQLTWDETRRAVVRAGGGEVEMRTFVRAAIDALVADWRASASSTHARTSTVRDLPAPASDARPSTADKKQEP
jgi:hypothetical protein